MPTLLRRFLLWTLICAVSAVPCFALAPPQFDRTAMTAGVALFILIYTAVTSTEAFERFHNRPFVRRTMYLGYGLRMAISIALPLGVMADIGPGMFSVSFVGNVLRLPIHSFEGTLAITCVQGTLLNLILFVLMSVIYALQRAFMRPPEEPRGFSVVLPAQPVSTDV